ncbi:MAG: hypothetical protein LBT33_07390 [Spirochaetia bacterium]|jgi:hypothetical protein|nr:hypothetical protein [Spirochaetia bacterium]
MIRSIVVFFLALPALCPPLASWDILHCDAYGLEDLDIRENAEVRGLYKDIMVAPTLEVLKLARQVFSQRGQDHRVRVEVQTTKDAFYILFLNEEGGAFPPYARGNWIVKRDLATGGFVQIKIFFHSDPGSFVRIFPDRDGAAQGRCLMDVYLFNRRIQREAPLGSSLVSLLTLSFADIVEATRATVNWRNLIPAVDPAAYKDVRAMAAAIRPMLPQAREVADGAMDKNGRMVFIDSLRPQGANAGFNCSGFVKWIADALYAPLAGEYLDIGELKTKHPGSRGSSISLRYEKERDPFFGLDWSRNIALAFARLEPGKTPDIESSDVRDLPYWKYIEDIGFPSADIPAILYYLALREPGNVYIASVNREFGENPVLRQHIHVAFLLPAIDAEGRFSCTVMDTTVESSMKQLVRRGDFIHLVRIKASAGFELPLVKNEP